MKVFELSRLNELKEKTIEGERIRLVPFSSNHLHNACYFTWLQDYDVIKYLNLPAYVKGIDFKEVESYIASVKESKDNLFFAVETTDANIFIGTCKIGVINWHAENANLGILIGDKNYWGKGLATEIFTVAIEFCFSVLSMHKVTGGCMEKNIGMQKVFKKLGFTEEGCFREQDYLEGEFQDHYHYGLLKKEYEENNKDEK